MIDLEALVPKPIFCDRCKKNSFGYKGAPICDLIGNFSATQKTFKDEPDEVSERALEGILRNEGYRECPNYQAIESAYRNSPVGKLNLRTQPRPYIKTLG